MRPPVPGECEFCPLEAHVLATHAFTDCLGFEYRLCERHFAPLRAWLRRREERERRRLARRLESGSILPVEDTP